MKKTHTIARHTCRGHFSATVLIAENKLPAASRRGYYILTEILYV